MSNRLTDLPLSIIHEILGRVPVRDAIRTCLLSKEWRYTWITLPRLDFSCEEDRSRWITENFISNVLLHHKGPIHMFEVDADMLSTNISIDSIEKWMLCLSRKDIRELIMCLVWEKIDDLYVVKNLKSSIYSCVKLTKLWLWNFTLDPPPSTFKGFLALTTLQLYCFIISTDEVESLIDCCPLLETLEMVDCSCSEVRFRSPNLKNLRIVGDQDGLCLYAPLLAKMEVTCAFLAETETIVCNYTNLLGCLTNLVELSGHYNFIQYLSVGIDSCQHTLVLRHLTVIDLSIVDLAYPEVQYVVARLIFGAPNLHKLLLGCCMEYGLEPPYVSFEDFGWEPNFTFEKLREVSVESVCDYTFGMRLIKLLLESSPVLETVYVYFTSPEAGAELLSSPRSSPNARILAPMGFW